MYTFFNYKNILIRWWQRWCSAAISQVFSVTWSFRNHFNMLIWCSRTFLITVNIENSCLIFFIEFFWWIGKFKRNSIYLKQNSELEINPLILAKTRRHFITLTMIWISRLQTCRSCSLLTYILFRAQRTPWLVRTRKTIAKPPTKAKTHCLCCFAENKLEDWKRKKVFIPQHCHHEENRRKFNSVHRRIWNVGLFVLLVL